MKKYIAPLALLLSSATGMFAQSARTTATLDTSSIVFVDGTKYSALADALASCVSPGCVVYDNVPETFGADPFASLPANVFAEVHFMRQTWVTNAQIVVPNKSQIIGSGRGDANSTGTVIQAGPSFPKGMAVLEMGARPISAAVRISNLTVDCHNRSGAIGIQNTWSQEESGIQHILLANCPGIGLDLETSGAQNSGPYEDLEVLDQASCTNCSAATIPIVIDATGVFRGVHGATINSDGAATPDIGMRIDTQGTFNDIHCEHITACFVIGSQLAVGGATIFNVECGPSITTCVEFSKAYRSQNLTAIEVNATTGNLILDQLAGNTLSAATEGGSVAFYSVGNGSPHPVLTTSTSIPVVAGSLISKTSLTGTAVIASGPSPGLSGTGACTTFSSQTGGAWAGSFRCTGSSGAATITITLATSAPNGWTCKINDLTMPVDSPNQTSTSKTTCVFSTSATAKGDLLNWTAIAY